MKKILSTAAALSLAVLSANAIACPKGTTLQGGTGPHHKGGKCVAVMTKKADTKKQQITKKDKSQKQTNTIQNKF